MDIIEFIKMEDRPDEHNDGFTIMINGKDLKEILKNFELPFAEKEGHPKIAGAYGELTPKVLYSYLNNKQNDPTIYACECGEVGCWPMVISIEENDKTITWKNFRQPFRRKNSKSLYWDFTSFPTFTFEKEKYNLELKKLLD